jgi:hypothetical protein
MDTFSAGVLSMALIMTRCSVITVYDGFISLLRDVLTMLDMLDFVLC